MAEEPTTPDLKPLVQRVTGFQKTSEIEDRTSEIEDLMSFFAPDSVWDMSRGGLGVIEGRGAILAFFEEWWGAYEDYQQKAEEIQDLGNGVAVAVFVQRGRPVDSTGWVEFRDARVLLWADGLIERVTTFLDIDEARAAAKRLAEERGSAVSEANVEIVRRLVEAFYARDAQAALSILDRDMTFESAFAEAKTYTGVGEFAQYRRDVDEAWGKWRSEEDRFLPVDQTRMLHLYRIVGRGRGSGVPVAQDIAILWTLRQGRVVHGKVYLDRREARRAAGLEG